MGDFCSIKSKYMIITKFPPHPCFRKEPCAKQLNVKLCVWRPFREHRGCGGIENNITMLESMAYNPSHRGSSVAQILLSEAGIAEFEPEIFLPMEDRSMRFLIVQEAHTNSFDLNDMIEVYPTPASSEIWIEYLLIDSKPVSKIDIYDVEGKLVLTQSIRNGFGLERVDVSQLSEGNYVLKMGDFSKQISIMK